jgi:thiamine-monophosphate kinase
LVENIHFSLVYTPLKYVGYKAVIVNLSDIYAMNALPKQITFSFAVSSRFTYEALDELYQGVYQACENYGVDLVGGDTTSSRMGMFLAITAIGQAKQENIVYRNGAQPGDLICVSGDLGAAYMGLQLIERERKIIEKNPEIKPDWSGKEYILRRQLRPEARKDIIELFEKQGVKPNAMIDISDGLSSEILHICKQSGVGAKIYEDRLPIDAETRDMAEEMHLDPTIAAMNGGEDYELLFTLPTAEYTKIKDFPGITVIGNIVEDKSYINLITRDGTEVPITAQGWNAYQDVK